MSSELQASDPPVNVRAVRPPRISFRGKRAKRGSPHTAHGEPMVWLTGGALAIALAMITCLLAVVLYQGLRTFWPSPVVQLHLSDGTNFMGEVSRDDDYTPGEAVLTQMSKEDAARAATEQASHGGQLHRRLVRTGNYDLSGTHFNWVDNCRVTEETRPEAALVIERLTWGRFYGTPVGFLEDDKETAHDATSAMAKLNEFHAAALARLRERVDLEKHALGDINRHKNNARLNVKAAELKYGLNSPQYAAAQAAVAEVDRTSEAETAQILAKIEKLKQENSRLQLRLKTADGGEKLLPLDEIVRAYPANQLSWFGKLGVYFSRWGEFLWDDPREANSEGGVFPAIFGTVVMTLLMSVAVVPFGVLAALYLREYAPPGPIVSAVRIAINNLAGVPSIVFGVFGLGFFCYVVGASIDQLFFPAALAENDPTFGTGGLMWASLTLALLTLPVVIITTEEALAAVPGSMREGSYACGASKWQTIKRIVLPRALPGIMTGMILAMARGAGEVAPLMLVGAMKLAPELPVDGVFPFVHPERSFMHLGFHLYDLGFQSANSEAAKPMVYTTTLLLIGIIAFLNIAAVWFRSRLRHKFVANHF
jgi:phosphate transport system permease protein